MREVGEWGANRALRRERGDEEEEVEGEGREARSG